MWLTDRQFWLLIHLGLGALYLHGFGTGLMGLSHQGRRYTLASLGAAAPPGMELAAYPRHWLLANAHLAGWHTFGMEWKEHIAWLSPMFATAVAYVVMRYRRRLTELVEIHQMLRLFLVLAFATGLVAGVFGGALNKVHPNAFLMQ
jgi:hypothetical protein